MQPNMASTILRFAQELTLHSYAPESFVKGRKQEAVTTTRPIKGVLQPTGGQDLLLVPEADRVKDLVTVWTTAEVKASSADTRTPGDVIEANGAKYKALTVFPRQINGFSKVIAERLNELN